MKREIQQVPQLGHLRLPKDLTSKGNSLQLIYESDYDQKTVCTAYYIWGQENRESYLEDNLSRWIDNSCRERYGFELSAARWAQRIRNASGNCRTSCNTFKGRCVQIISKTREMDLWSLVLGIIKSCILQKTNSVQRETFSLRDSRRSDSLNSRIQFNSAKIALGISGD